MSDAVELIAVPYDSALRETRMGRGPNALLKAGLLERLQGQGVDAHVTSIEPREEFRAEIATTFELQRAVRTAVEASVKEGRRPITISGNCNTGVVGSLAAHGLEPIGLFWFDAHSDAGTPDSTTSGFLDGMGFAMALGCCWRSMIDSVGSWTLDGRRAALVGAREITPAAAVLLEERDVAIVDPQEARSGSLSRVFERFQASGVSRVHVHVDLDVLDPELVGPANSYALPDGLTEAQLLRSLTSILESFELASASVASYDPEVDIGGAVARAGLDAIAVLATA
jgi:arginase